MANPAAGSRQPFDMPNLIPPTPVVAEEEDEGGFSSWWHSDSTQEKFQGMMGVISALGGGLAGIPAGGGDMSSMERAAVRAAAAPGEARKMMHQRRFARHIRSQLATEEDPERRMMLQGALSDPDNAMQYLSSQTPEAKEKQAYRIADYEQDHRLEITRMELASKEKIAEAKRLGTAARYGLTAFQHTEIMQANERYLNSPADLRKALDEDDYWGVEFEQPEMMKLVNKLWTPHLGQLWINKYGKDTTDPEAFKPHAFNLEGDVEVKDPKTGKPAVDPETGKPKTVPKVEAVMEALYGEGAPDPDPEVDAAVAYSVDKFEQRQGDLTTEQANKVAESLGLSRQDPLDFDPAGPFHTFDAAGTQATPIAPAPAPAPAATDPIAAHTSYEGDPQHPPVDPRTGEYYKSMGPEGASRSGLIPGMMSEQGGIDWKRAASDPYYGTEAVEGAIGSLWDWVKGERGYMTDYHNRKMIGPQRDTSPQPSEFGGMIGDVYSEAWNNKFKITEQDPFIGPVDEREQWHYRGPSMPEGKPSGVAADQRSYLDAKRRKSQIIDRRLRKKAEERIRLGL